MFEIEYKGGNSVTISTKKVKIVVDPKVSVVGLKDIDVKDAVDVATEAGFALKSSHAKLNIEGPGEYEIGSVSVSGMSAYRHIDRYESPEKLGTIYRVTIDDVRIAVLGNIAPKLSDDQLEFIGVVDILVLPVGGNGYTLDATSATVIAKQIEANVVIPVHYADSKLKYEVPQDDLDVFVKEFAAPVEKVGVKYKLKALSGIPAATTTVVIDRT